MSVKIIAYFERDLSIHNTPVSVDKIPDFCPLCHRDIKPEYRYAWMNGNKLQIVFLCPNDDCQSLFFSYYREPESFEMYKLNIDYYYIGSGPGKTKQKEFPKEIIEISEKFSEIYNQAYEAETRRLNEICGAGYRRALEFLIKEYLIKGKGEKDETIKKTWLDNCIKNYIEDQRIKDCAKRAVWIGNDETHYIREWEDKDLEDLKKLIQLTVNWIHNDLLTTQYVKGMPEKEKKKKSQK